MLLASAADLIVASPLFVLFMGSLTPLIVKVLNKNKEPNNFLSMIQGVGTILAALLLMVTVYFLLLSRANPFAFSNLIAVDGIAIIASTTCLLLALASLFLMRDNQSTNGDQFAELVFLTLNSVLGMLVLVMATDLLTLFVGIEVMSLALYMMIGISHEQKLSKEAAIKYFVLGSFASAILLQGIAFIYGNLGTTSITVLTEKADLLIGQSPLFAVGMIFLMIGFLFKVSLFPFHVWTADVYQGAPTPHTAFMSTAVKMASFAAFARIFVGSFLVNHDSMLNILQWIGAITIFAGNAGALVQNNLKRMLAFSSVAHSGYILMGIIVIGLGATKLGMTAVMFYLVTYSIMNMGALAMVSFLEKSYSDEISTDHIKGLAYKRPWLAGSFTVLLISLAGVPPALGFFGKFFIFTQALDQGLLWLTLWAGLGSVVGAYIYLKPIVYMYMIKDDDQNEVISEAAKDHEVYNNRKWFTKTVVLASAFTILVIGLLNTLLYHLLSARL